MSKRLFWSYEELLNLKEAIEQQWSNSIPSTRLGNLGCQLYPTVPILQPCRIDLTGGLTSTFRASQSPNKGNWTLGECSEAQVMYPVIGYITPRTWVYPFRRILWRRMVMITNSELPWETEKRNFKQENSHIPWDAEHWIFTLCSVRCPKCLYFG